jgi:aminoglycoside phosphotransferase (APT) family kinase protein
LSQPSLLAKDLGAFVVAMRAVDLPGAPAAHRGGPLSSLDVETRAGIDALREAEAEADRREGFDLDVVAEVWGRAMREPGSDTAPVWLHADLMPGNLLLDSDGRLASVIDFGCAGVGDPACDLFPAWNLLPADARQIFRDALDVDDATWRRGRARTLSQAVIALPYYRETNPSMARNARHVIGAVLDELDRLDEL